ncbi:MAG: L,D-transpeptidase family protein, partial [Gemmatimonadaceae bacterium]
ASERLADGRWPDISDVSPDLRRAYDSVAWQPLWLRSDELTLSARAVIAYLGALESVGLPPRDFDVARIESMAHAIDSGASTPDLRGRFEVTLSVAAARVLSALQWGRVSPRDAHEAFRISRTDFDLAGAEPRYVHYRLLKQQLARVRILAGDTSLLPLELADRVAPGDTLPAAPRLHRLLVALGDLAPPDTGFGVPDTVYTDALAEGVRSFQRRQGVTQDGIIGPVTRARLNRPFAQRVAQIELALERWRWLPREFGGRVIIANIPEFQLHAFDRLTSDSTALFSMDIVVGEAYDHSTPVFMEELEYLSFSPYWEVSASISRTEIRPLAARDSSYLAQHEYVLLRGFSESASPLPPTPENIADIGRSVRVRQMPGAQNALGRVKFMLPNPHNIYLHDTPAQSAFDRARRDLSHGCIRLSDPKRLALWVLRDRPEWTSQKVDSAMALARPLNVSLSERIPVLIVNSTAVAKLNGDLALYADIYGHDTRLAALLARGFPYSR